MKIISGAQIGADIAGLRAAKRVGFETGGWMPKGYRTLLGPRPEYAEHYGIQQTSSWTYPPRTAANVRDSDATLRFAVDWQSPGEKLTLRELIRQRKPHLSMDVPLVDADPNYVAEWLIELGARVVNVAGNGREEIEEPVEEFLVVTFTLVKEA